MAICYDTNLLILFVRDSTPNENVRRLVNPNKKAEYISLVSTVELKSFAVQNGWGGVRMSKMQILLDSLNVVDINDSLILDRYVAIDAFANVNTLLLHHLSKHPEIWVKMIFG